MQNTSKANTQEERSYKDWNGFWKETVNELGARRRNERYVMGGATSHVTENCGKCSDDIRRYGKSGHFFINCFDKFFRVVGFKTQEELMTGDEKR